MKDSIEDFKFVFLEGNRWKSILDSLKVIIGVNMASVFVGFALGLILAIMKMTAVKKNRRMVLSVTANIYTNIIRGVPSILQLLIMYFVVFRSRMGIVTVTISLGMNSAAYMAENIRAGVIAVDQGQMRGGCSLRLSYDITMRYTIIPQAVENILPALGNGFVLLIKEMPVLGYIVIYDLAKAANYIASRAYKMFLSLIRAAMIHYVITKTPSTGLVKFERRLRESD